MNDKDLWAGAPEKWLPTSENINRLPEPIRAYIHHIETNSDPAGMVRENIIAKDTITALQVLIAELQGNAGDSELQAHGHTVHCEQAIAVMYTPRKRDKK